MEVNSSPAYFQTLGEVNQLTSLVFCTDGIQAFSVLIETIGGMLDNQSYTVYISGNKSEWISLYELKLGYSNLSTNSFSYNSPMNGALLFRFVKISVPPISGVATKIMISAR